MNFLVLGINHNTACVALRERIAFTPEQVPEALHELLSGAAVDEVAILSTCNRTEIYAVTHGKGLREILHWLAEFHSIGVEEIENCHYVYWDDAAVQHMVRVASGLDSLVLGEPQVLGQFKSAFAIARAEGGIGPALDRLFRRTVEVARRVRTETAIGENPVSVAYAAVSLARRIFTDLADSSALLIGAGEIMTLVARHLSEQGVTRMVVANRTLDRAREMAEEFGAESALLAEIPERLAAADIVISSTASQLPILGKGAVESALRKRRHRPVFMVDLAVPRDVEPEVGDLGDVYLYSVDDLRDVVEENKSSRNHAAREAEQIIVSGTETFMKELRAMDAVKTLKEYRRKVEEIRDVELERARRLIEQGGNANEVLEEFANKFANKLMHEPSLQLKKAGAEGRNEFVTWVRELFNLPEHEPRRSEIE